mmetsp:Transcript_9782/g.19829  ORF Transcript_9782/g.19829 Transcript_9782/m.19829 type:complete len:946 (-) Transcript_9782:235-3072(-)
MYQNAPPQGYGGGPPSSQQQYGGYPTYPNRQYGNTYQQPATAATPNTAPDAATAIATNNNNSTVNKPTTTTTTTNSSSGAVSSGLIRLTLRKPMGIVFEPTPDPHNPSQQRGVRICDLPRTGAAFLSGKLQVGDELLSINDKTMSRLTFDEIMDFIIVADKERVDLLFRRPTKEKQAAMQELQQQQQAAAASMHVSKSVEPSREVVSPTAPLSQSNSVKWVDDGKGKAAKVSISGGGGGGRKGRSSSKEEEEEDMEEPPRRSRGGGKSSSYSKRRDERDEVSVGDEYTVESQSQYTMETYEDERKGGRKGGRGGDRRRDDRDKRSKRDVIESGGFLDLLIDTLCTSVIGRDPYNRRGGKSKYDDYDDDHTYDDGTYDDATYDDETYATYEERDRRRRKDDRSYVTEDEGTLATEDDGTRTVETNDESYVDRRKERIKQNFREHQNRIEEEEIIPSNNRKVVAEKEESPDDEGVLPEIKNSPPQAAAPDPPTMKTPQVQIDEESAVDTLQVPLRELNFDQDYAADVSVMESLGGPSLLVERARLDYAVNAGAGQAAKFDNLENQDPELAKLVAVHGDGFEYEPGMSKEEAAFRDPFAFYEHAVTVLLRENEPEKVRLLSKLMAKYKGRERHLIHKLSARYKKEEKEGAGGEAVETKTSGMEKIQEGEEDTSINDPTRANIDAIETAKKKMESGGDGGWGDGWPPAMSDPWGAGNNDEAAADSKPQIEEPVERSAAAPAGDDSRPLDEEDSYSDGSSYTGDSGMDGTSPAIIAQVSELLNYVYGKTSVAGQIDRVSTIMRAYEGREAVLLELLETKALIKANADTNGDVSEIPQSVRENPGLNTNVDSGGGSPNAAEPPAPQAPMTVVTTPTAAANYPTKMSSPTVKSPKNLSSPSEATTESSTSKKKKKGMFKGIFGSSKKKDKKGNFPISASSKKGQQLNDDGSI